MNRITLTIAGFLLASGTYAMANTAYGADRDTDKDASHTASVHKTKFDVSSRHDDDSDASSNHQRDASPEGNPPTPMSNVASQEVKLSNPSNMPIEDIDVRVTGKDAKDFRQTNNCGEKLDGGGSCTISVTFQPKTAGDKSATMEVHTSGGNKVIYLTGTGT